MTSSADEVTVEAVAPAEIEPADAGLPLVGSREVAQIRERARMMIASGVLFTTALIALGMAAESLFGEGDSPTAVEPYFTSLIGLSGAIIGWYFGGKGSSE